MIEYCTARELELSPVVCVDLLVDLRSDIEGVSQILRAVAYEVPSPNRAELMALFRSFCRDHGILCDPEECFAYLHEFPVRSEQLSLFD